MLKTAVDLNKTVYIGTVGGAHYNEFMSHVCEGTYVKTFDTEKYKSLEEARMAKDLMFGVNEHTGGILTTIHYNEFLPKAHKTNSPKVKRHGFIACQLKDVLLVKQRLIDYMTDPDNVGQEAPILFKTTIPAYRKYGKLTGH